MDMASFSIIVPFIGDDLDFENTLASVLRNNADQGEIIVVHDGTYEDVYGLEGEVQFVATERRAQLIRMFNAGLRVSKNEFVLLIRPGMELPFNWEAIALESFEDPNVASIGPAIVAADGKSELLAAGVSAGLGNNRILAGRGVRLAPRNLRKLKPLGPTSWAAAFRRSALEQLGTPDETLDPVYLDLDLAMSLDALGYRTKFVSDLVVSTQRCRLIAHEAEAPHGCSAQRASSRYPEKRKGSLLLSMICELAQSPFRPSLLAHLFQRAAANQYSDIDAIHANRLRDRSALQKMESTEFDLGTLRRAA